MPVAPNDDGGTEDHDGSVRDRFGDHSLLVVGAGPVGRWIAGVLRAGDTAFSDIDHATAQRAAERVDGRAVELDSTERFDLVGIAVPISAAEKVIATHASRARACLFDVTGTMSDPMTAMATHTSEIERVSLHPLFAPERAPGRVAWVAGREHDGEEANGGDERGSGSIAAGIIESLRAAGNEPFPTTPAEHDRAMETIQARAHAAVLSYALAAEPIDERFHTPVSEALGEVASRVTGGTSGTYAEIQTAFEGSEDVAAMARRVADADGEEFRRLYREARAESDARSRDGERSAGDTESSEAAGSESERK